jgi:hypothetical protein
MLVAVQSPLLATVERKTKAGKYNQNKEKTDQRVTDESGHALTRLQVRASVNGSVVEATIEAPDHVLEAVEPDYAFVVSGDLQAVLTGGDFGAIRTKISGVKQVTSIGSVAAIFDNILKSAVAQAQK